MEYSLFGTSHQFLKDHGQIIYDDLLKHILPLGWEYINLAGDYLWTENKTIGKGKFRPLRITPQP